MDTTGGRSPQRRAIVRRNAITEGAARILLRDGMGSVTHRSVASEADVPLASIRYYFETRELLLLACIDRLDAERSDAATAALAKVHPDVGEAELARLLLQVYDGPDLGDDALRGSIGWVLDCARESAALSARLVDMRKTLDVQVRGVLDAAGRTDIATGTVGAIIDGSVFTACVERREGIESRVIAELLPVLGRTERHLDRP